VNGPPGTALVAAWGAQSPLNPCRAQALKPAKRPSATATLAERVRFTPGSL